MEKLNEKQRGATAKSKDMEEEKENPVTEEEFLKNIEDYREKANLYNEEKLRLETILNELNAELKLSQQKDEEDCLVLTEKEKTEFQNTNNIEEGITTKESETQKGKDLSDANKIIDQIPGEDRKVIEETMRKDKPMEFESPKVKTNYKDFVKNSVVKLFSGFKIPSKIKNIIEKNAQKILMTTAVLTIWTSSGSFIKPNGVKGEVSSLKNKEITDAINKNKSLEIIDIETYNKLSKNGKRIYLYAGSKIEGSYIIVDKPSATLFVVGSDKKLISQMPVLLGQTKGETPNRADPESDIAIEATTPAGKYTMGRLGINDEDQVLYKGKIFSIYGSKGLRVHITYPLEKEKRMKALNTPTPNDNRLSWGCINIGEEMWTKLEGNIKDRGTCMFITPDDPTTSLNPETGQIEKAGGNHDLLAMNNINN